MYLTYLGLILTLTYLGLILTGTNTLFCHRQSIPTVVSADSCVLVTKTSACDKDTMHAIMFMSYLGFLKGLLQDLVHVLVNLGQLVLLDVALAQQTLGILLVGVLMLSDGLYMCICQRWSPFFSRRGSEDRTARRG